MEQIYNIRPIMVEDYTILMEWWKSYDGIEIPDSSILPTGGLGGFVIEKKERMIAAAYIYFTNSAIAYIDFLISDPNYKSKDRYEIIAQLIVACSNAAVKQGSKLVWAITTYNGVIQRCKELGGDVLDNNYTVIYTHKVHS